MEVKPHRSVQSIPSWPCSWPAQPLWCGPPPAGSACGPSWRSPWPPSRRSPALWLARPWLADASPAWAVRSEGLRCPGPAEGGGGDMKLLSIILSYCISQRSAFLFYKNFTDSASVQQPYLFVDLSQLLQIVLQEWDFLFLCNVAESLLTVKLCTLIIEENYTKLHSTTSRMCQQ